MMVCENCGVPTRYDTGGNVYGTTGFRHTDGRLWCRGRDSKANPIRCARRGCTEPATVQPTGLGLCPQHIEEVAQ
jgi:hypothetical protein